MISVVVPIYNEEVLVRRFHEALSNALEDINEDWEAVYVNDGSRDASLEILKEIAASDPHAVVVELSRNWGHMGAISAGLLTARGDAVVLMDGDFQDPPEVVPELVEAWRNGAEVVVAVRRSRQESRRLLARLFPLFYRVLGALSDFPIPLDAGIFGLLNRQAVDAVNSLRERNRYLPGLRAWVGYKSDVVYYDRHDRLAGDGKLSFVSRIKYAMDAITSFSYKPLRLAFALATVAVVIAALLGVSTIFTQDPFHSAGLGISAAIFVMGSMLLLCMGILGEYMGRVYDEVRSRPLSIISRVHSQSEMIPAQNMDNYEEMKPASGFGVHVA